MVTERSPIHDTRVGGRSQGDSPLSAGVGELGLLCKVSFGPKRSWAPSSAWILVAEVPFGLCNMLFRAAHAVRNAGGVFGFSGKRLHEDAVLAHVGGVLPVLIRVSRGA